jgi:ubiquinone/menaquinone biosynthesis C-methylase UbiE
MDDPSKLAWRGVFNRSAPTYDQVGRASFAAFGRQLVSFAGLPEGGRVLDVACGRGAVLQPAAAAVGRAGRITGIDLAETMVSILAGDLRRGQVMNAGLCNMDAECLAFADGAFDAVVCGFAIFFFPNPGRALAEFRRVLAPGGRITLSTWGENDQRWQWLDDLYTAALPPAPEPAAPDASAGPQKEAPDYHTEEGMRRVMFLAGFEQVEVAQVEYRNAFASEEEWWQTSWSHGFRSALEAIEQTGGPARLARFKEEAFQKLQQVREGNLFTLTQRALVTRAVRR